jgi:hypothetical protein
MDFAVIGAARFTAYRMSYQREWRNTGLEHMTPEFLHKYPFTLKQDRLLKTYQLVKQFRVLILTREEWCMPGKITDLNADLLYADGSGINNHFGASVNGPRDNRRKITFIGSLFRVFQAEVMAS